MVSTCESRNAASGRVTDSNAERAQQMSGNVVVDIARLLAMMLENEAVESSEVAP